MFRKAQAAMEFLMTYGWAILVVLVAIGALAYFGVLSPGDVLPDKCTGSPGLDCVEVSIMGTNVTFLVRNNLGYSINASASTSGSITSSDCSAGTLYNCSGGTCSTLNSMIMRSNEMYTLMLDCPDIVNQKRAKVEFDISYRNLETNLNHKSHYSISAKIQ